MKVLQTICGLGAKLGGIATSTYDLLSAIHAVEPEVCVDVLTVAVKAPTDRMLGNGESWIKVVENDYKTPLAFSRNISRFLKENDYDIYHTNGLWLYINHATCAMARRRGKPYLITSHGMLYPHALRISAWKKWPMRKVWFDRDIFMADCVHVTCRQEMDHVRELGYKGSVAIIGNPVRVPEYIENIIAERSYDGYLTIGFLGRLHPIKRIENILRGVALAADKAVNVIIIGKGDDDYESFLRQEAERLQIADRVTFAGFLTGKEKFEALASLSALFVPSDMENFGMIVPEALIVGTPVMSSLGTPWEALNAERCGWWCDNSAETIAGVIDELSSLSPQQRQAMGARGRDYILRTFADTAIASRMLQLYRWLDGKGEQPEFVNTR